MRIFSAELSRQSRSRSLVSGSVGGEVPEKYYVVRNNEVMRLKYLLVYAEKKAKKPSLRQ
jgi:poly[ADP-ribose] polymerase 16